jgi:hypothetical protein
MHIQINSITGYLSLVLLLPLTLYAQLDELHGDEQYSYEGVHSGNLIRVSFYNDGMLGQREANPDDFMGEWPINSGHLTINQIIFFIGAEVRDVNGEYRIIVSEGNGIVSGNTTGGLGAASGDAGPLGEWWTMCPLPGFANDAERRIAMSHWDWSWPGSWPDKFDDVIDPGWPDSWNGYFGKNVLNADQESYYVMDDYNNREFAFYPDSTDTERRGLGIRGTIRGFQWSNVLVEDILFFLYDAKNIGTTSHDKMNFGIMSGPHIGHTEGSGNDASDDGGEYDLEQELGFHTDQDWIGGGGRYPVEYHGIAFFESPGNPYDGIDNDGDGSFGSGATITADMFAPRVVNVGEQVVLTDYQTFERRVVPMPQEGVQIVYQRKTITFFPGEELVEVENDLIDNNLNGLIDENNGSQFGEGDEAITRYLYLGLKCVDYLTGEGLDNILLDEKRDDGIDNDDDWDVNFDDVGLDGVPNTGDPGEGDGRPTSGRGTNLPGEPHIDKTDIDESDMIGLTAFNIYTPWTVYPLSDDQHLWDGIKPGFLNAMGQFGDTDIMLGSGFFPLKPAQTERFSIGILYGMDREDLFINKSYAAKTYHENYNFAKAPLIPTVNAVAGDNRVTLYWDDLAESSIDPISGKDFEGYRIYRSTDPGWNDLTKITDMYGAVSYHRPIAQFDLDNEYAGMAEVPVKGVHFNLGDNTGLEHTWVDTTVVNGFTYYYAVTSYDHGDSELGIAPTECSKYIIIDKRGAVEDMGKNVVFVRPEAPSAGYVSSAFTDGEWLAGSTTTGEIIGEIVDPPLVKARRYEITFEDTLISGAAGIYLQTKNFTLTDITDQDFPDVLMDGSTLPGADVELPIVNGFRLHFSNEEMIALNEERSGWNREGIYAFKFTPYRYSSTVGESKASDYRVEFGEVGMATSSEFSYREGRYLPATAVNFKVINLSEDKEIAFAFWARDGEDGVFSAFTEGMRSDWIILQEEHLGDSVVTTWNFELIQTGSDSTTEIPQSGDVVTLNLTKPFFDNDIYQFSTKPETTNEARARGELSDIKVVPNPYVATNSWEPHNPYSTGRGPRELHFIHLPPKCTIKIFNIQGQLVQTLHHNEPVWNGTEIWNMQTKDNLDIAYGVYFYHVDAGKLGEKMDKFAVIK